MNKQRRKSIEKVIGKLEEFKEELTYLLEEEQDYYDNMPEGIQSGEKGDKALYSIDTLESAISSIDEAIENANESIE